MWNERQAPCRQMRGNRSDCSLSGQFEWQDSNLLAPCLLPSCFFFRLYRCFNPPGPFNPLYVSFICVAPPEKGVATAPPFFFFFFVVRSFFFHVTPKKGCNFFFFPPIFTTMLSQHAVCHVVHGGVNWIIGKRWKHF